MPGKRCNGVATEDPTIRESSAYCEGRLAATNGAALGTNPHPTGTRDNAMWASGHGSYNGGTGSALPLDCCAVPAYDGVP